MVNDLVKQNNLHRSVLFWNWSDSLLVLWLPVCGLTQLASPLSLNVVVVCDCRAKTKLFWVSHNLQNDLIHFQSLVHTLRKVKRSVKITRLKRSNWSAGSCVQQASLCLLSRWKREFGSALHSSVSVHYTVYNYATYSLYHSLHPNRLVYHTVSTSWCIVTPLGPEYQNMKNCTTSV